MQNGQLKYTWDRSSLHLQWARIFIKSRKPPRLLALSPKKVVLSDSTPQRPHPTRPH